MLFVVRVVITAKNGFFQKFTQTLARMVQFLHDRNLAVETFQDLKSEEKGKGQAGEGEIQTTDIQQKMFKVNNFTSFHFEINMV